MATSRLAMLPNLICVVRILLTAPIVYYLISGSYTTALVLIVVAGFSDGLDGYLARHYGWTSRVGGLLDPFADLLAEGPLPHQVLCVPRRGHSHVSQIGSHRAFRLRTVPWPHFTPASGKGQLAAWRSPRKPQYWKNEVQWRGRASRR